MKNKHEIRMKQLHDEIHYVRPKIQPPVELPLQVKERYKEQFDKAMEVVREHLNQVSSIDEMTRYLNDQGYKTRTGKSWTISTLYREVKKLDLRFPRKTDGKVKAYEALKDQYRAQYQDGAKLMEKLYKEGVQISEIYDALKAQGYKTITGRKWTEANIRNTIGRFRKQ
jgi:tRNA splicing endonuclease